VPNPLLGTGAGDLKMRAIKTPEAKLKRPETKKK